jgi:hypothetical protein
MNLMSEELGKGNGAEQSSPSPESVTTTRHTGRQRIDSSVAGNGNGAASPEVARQSSSEPPLAAAATPPPPQSTTAQPGAPKARLDFNKARVKGLQPTQTAPQATRLPVIDRPDPSKFFCVHPEHGGFAYPVYLWRRKGSGKGASSVIRMVTDEMAIKIDANGGEIMVAGLYWGHYHKGGDFILAVNLESDNEYTKTSRDIYEKGRSEWVKRINLGGYYGSKEPNVPIAPHVWEPKTWPEILSLGFQEIVDSEDHPDFVELVHARADTAEEQGLTSMGERMARVERMAASIGVVVTKTSS